MACCVETRFIWPGKSKHRDYGGEIRQRSAAVTFAIDHGAIYDFNEHDHFLFSAGRGLQNADTTNDLSWYVGFLLTGP